MNKIFIASDHAGVELKAFLKSSNVLADYEVIDLGPETTDSVDYPDYAHPLAQEVEANNCLGILICGSANGVCMTANKHKNIRAGLAWIPEIAALTRQHNNANVICIPARFVDNSLAEEILKAFIETPFEGGRHQKRVDKI